MSCRNMSDYIQWSGGPMPVDPDVYVDVILANGECWYKERARDLSWCVPQERRKYLLRIVGYRVCERTVEKIPNAAKYFRYVQPVHNNHEITGWNASDDVNMKNKVFIPIAGKGVEYISLNDLW